MEPKNIIESVFRFEEVRPVPYMTWLGQDTSERIDEHYGSSAWRDRLVTYVAGGHLVGDCGSEDQGNGLTRSPFGYVTRQPLCHLEQPAPGARPPVPA